MTPKRLSEKDRADMKLKGFECAGSPGEKFLEQLFQCPPREVVSKDTLQVARICAHLIGQTIPRICRRRKDGLIWWFDQHYNQLLPHLPFFEVELRPVTPRTRQAMTN